MSLFLAEAGYYSIHDVFSILHEVNIYATEQGDYYAPYQIPEAKDAMIEMKSWFDEELVEEYHYASSEINEYATIFLEAYGLLGSSPIYADIEALDLKNYRINILYNDKLPALPVSKKNNPIFYAVAQPNVDIEQYLVFMEWLETEENYYSFMYGIEGVDYSLSDSNTGNKRISFLETEVKYHNWDYKTNFFYRNKFDSYLPENLPYNYETESAKIYSPFEIPIDATKIEDLEKDILSIIKNDFVLEEEMFLVKRKYWRLEKLIVAGYSIDSLITDYFETMNSENPLEEVIELLYDYSE